MGTLAQGPPPPPGIGAPPKPSLSGLAGGGQAPQQAQDPQLQQSVMEKMMLVEKTLQAAATEMPALGPVVQDLIQQFRSRVGAIVLSQQAQEQPQGGSTMGSLVAGPAPAPATS